MEGGYPRQRLQRGSDARRRHRRRGHWPRISPGGPNPSTHRNPPSQAPAARRATDLTEEERPSDLTHDAGEVDTPDQHLPPSRCPRSRGRRPASVRAPPRRRVDVAHQARATALNTGAPTEQETSSRLPYLSRSGDQPSEPEKTAKKPPQQRRAQRGGPPPIHRAGSREPQIPAASFTGAAILDRERLRRRRGGRRWRGEAAAGGARVSPP